MGYSRDNLCRRGTGRLEMMGEAPRGRRFCFRPRRGVVPVLYARAATYLRPRAVPTVQASASAAALFAPPRASARTSGVVESKRQADVAAVIVAIVPESVEPWEPSKGRIVRCFQFFTGSKMYFWIGAVTVAHGPSAAVRYWPTICVEIEFSRPTH